MKRRILLMTLSTGTALASATIPAWSDPAPAAAVPAAAATGPAGSAQVAQAATSTIPVPSRDTAEEIVIQARRRHATAGGLIKVQTDAKSVSTISSAFIQTQAAIQNAYQYIQLAPGALVATTDPYGLSEQFSINIRGLGQDELGYVLEGMPVNDIGFYTAYPSQFIDSENIDEVSLKQGSADLDSPVISAAGGIMYLSMLDPSVRPGGSVDFSLGSFSTDREFFRLDSGLIGDTDLRAFVSYSHTNSDQWRGPGAVHREHVDFKLVDEWGDGNRIAFSGEYHNGETPTYLLPTLAAFQQYGSDPNNPNLNYGSSFTPGSGDYWRLNDGTFRIVYLASPTRLILTDDLTFNTTPYWQYGYGNSPYGTTLTEAGNYEGLAGPFTINIPNYAETGGVVMANYQDLQYRAGLNSKLTYKMGANSIVLGYWFDYSDETDTQSYSTVNAQGIPPDLWQDTNAGLLYLPNGKPFLAGGDHVITEVNEAYLGDILTLFDEKLTLEAGFKEAAISRHGTNDLPGPQYHANINNSEPLPRLAARYKIDDDNQVFISATTNFRTPSEATLFDAYSGGYRYFKANTGLKPEYSLSEEVGYRYTGPFLTGSATFFNYNFANRQIATLVGGNLINESINAGGQTSRGLDLELGTRRWHHLSAYVSGEYLHATIDNDLPVGTDYLPTRGKTAVRSPEFQAGLGLSYDDGDLFSNLNIKYVDKQYSTFMNDESIPSYVTMDLGVGYRLPDIGLNGRPEVKLNLINLNEGAYLSGVSTPTANANTTVGRYGTQITGSSPSYYLSSGFTAIFTAKQAF